MKKILFIFCLIISTLVYSQQTVELCDYNQTQFIYKSYINQEGTFTWYLNNSIVSQSKELYINWREIGNFTITAEFENTNGCVGQETYQVEVLECRVSTIYVPNCFTPNGDLNNQIFIPVGNNVFDVEFYIFNRWGQQIFKGDLTKGWDGTSGGQISPIGNYLWYLTFTDIRGRKQIRTGDVTLLR